MTVSGAPYGGPGFMRLWMKLGYKFELFGRNRRKLEVFGTSVFFGESSPLCAQQAELARPPPPAYRGVLSYPPVHRIRVVVQVCKSYTRHGLVTVLYQLSSK